MTMRFDGTDWLVTTSHTQAAITVRPQPARPPHPHDLSGTPATVLLRLDARHLDQAGFAYLLPHEAIEVALALLSSATDLSPGDTALFEIADRTVIVTGDGSGLDAITGDDLDTWTRGAPRR